MMNKPGDFSLHYNLKTRRNLILKTLKKMDGEEQIIYALKHLSLIQKGAWPIWMDADLVEHYAMSLVTPTSLAKHYKEDVATFKEENLHSIVDTLLTSNHFLWRVTSSTSPDRLQFWSMLTYILCQSTLVQRTKEKFLITQFPVLPQAEDTLSNIQNIWIASSEDEDDTVKPLRSVALLLETGMLFNIISSELAHINCIHTAQTVGSLIRHFYRSGLIMPGMWLDDIWTTWSVRQVLSTFGDEYYSRGLKSMMESADIFMSQIQSIGHNREIHITENERQHRFFLLEDNTSLNDPDGWMMMALRASLVLGMSSGGSMIIEKTHNLNVDGTKIKEIYAAALRNEDWVWLDKENCKAVHSYDIQTGEPYAKKVGHIYRGWAEDFAPEEHYGE
jgi:hypothetical protein